MKWIGVVGVIVLAVLTLCLAVAVSQQDGKGASPSHARADSTLDLAGTSAAEQSDWLDANLLKLLALMADSPEVCDRIAGPLDATRDPPSLLTPQVAGLAGGDLERLSALIHSAVASNPRYGKGAAVKPACLRNGDALDSDCPGRGHVSGAVRHQGPGAGPADLRHLGLPRPKDHVGPVLVPKGGLLAPGHDRARS